MRGRLRTSGGLAAGVAAGVAIVALGFGACAGGQSAPAPTSADSAQQLQAMLAAPENEPLRGYTRERTTITMPDGVKLAIAYWKPDPLGPGERVPIVLSANPYRQDDDEYPGNYWFYPYFPQRGVAIATLDIRGTGGSEGAFPEREYSDAELADLVEAVDQLSKLPWSNGSIGMMGISWSGFNALMTAMRRPPALKTVVAVHASTDLYGNDIHYIDGVLHPDMYSLAMEVVTTFPKSPEYLLDQQWQADHLDRPSWIVEYFRHQRDSDWWQEGRSLKSDWSSLQIPVYAIGGLLDGYRDFAVDLLDHSSAPVYAEIGPWNHAYPDEGLPNPVYEWRREAVRWFRHWLADDPSVPFDGKVLTAFQRGPVPPDPDLDTTPGQFVVTGWPAPNPVVRLDPQSDLSLRGLDPASAAPPGGSQPASATQSLAYRPGAGDAVGNWWGETTGDMRSADRYSLVYDSPALTQNLLMQGTASAHLNVASSAPMADWFVRVEDVWPDGKVSLVTGGSINGAQRNSRTEPEPLVPGQFVELSIPLRYSTYTFAPGHKIRMAVTNAQFPMAWPTPYAMTTQLKVGDPGTYLDLPTTSGNPPAQMPEPVVKLPDDPNVSITKYPPPQAPQVISNGKITRTREEVRGGNRQYDRGYAFHNQIDRWVDNTNPARAGMTGTGIEWYSLPGRKIRFKVVVSVTSDARAFHMKITRTVKPGDGRPTRTRVITDSIPRDFQ